MGYNIHIFILYNPFKTIVSCLISMKRQMNYLTNYHNSTLFVRLGCHFVKDCTAGYCHNLVIPMRPIMQKIYQKAYGWQLSM